MAAALPLAPADPQRHAREAGLRYVRPGEPGLARRKHGSGFSYVTPGGRLLDDPEDLARIRALAIPPAWTDVWICADDRGHLQATGRDARGRKQYRYHAAWRATRDEAKYGRLLAFGAALARIRARVRRDLARAGMPREKVLAAIVRLLETTFVRVGNAEYARDNGSFGLTTIRNHHATVRGATIRLRFRGKTGKMHDVAMSDPRVARIVRRCQELPGQELFCYQDADGTTRDVTSTHVNEYLREITGADVTAKDFRTWAGTLLCASELAALEGRPSKRRVAAAVQRVAAALGNTPAVCRKCYVHPAVIEAYLEGAPLGRGERALLAALRERG